MKILLIFLILFSISAALAYFMKYRFEQTISITCLALIVVMYLSGLSGYMLIGVYICAAAGMVAVVLCAVGTGRGILKKDFWLDSVFSPGFAVFCVFFALICFSHTGRMLTEWDEFSHWGLVVKNMYYLNAFGNHPEATTVFKGYPPASALFQYLWAKLYGSFHEDNLFRSMNILSFSLMTSVFKSIDWKNKKLIPVIALIIFFLPVIFYNTFYRSIYVDALLGILFAYILFIYFTADRIDVPFIINLVLALFVLTLVKASGFGLAVIASLIIILDLLIQPRLPRNKEITKKSKRKTQKIEIPDIPSVNPLKIILPIILTPVVADYSWSIYRKFTDTPQAWSGMSTLTLPAVASFFKMEAEPYKYTIVGNFFKALMAAPISMSFFKMTVFQWALFFVLFIALILYLVKDEFLKSRIAVFSGGVFAGGVLYTLSLLILYIFTYSEYEATRLASFDRYMGTYLLACLISSAFCFTRFFAEKAQVHKIKSTGTCLALYLIVLCVFVNFESVFMSFSPDSTNQSKEIRQSLGRINRIVTVLNREEDTVGYIYQNSNGYPFCVARYDLTPINISGAWSIGTPYYNGDVWTNNITCEEWTEQLKENCTYVYLAYIDEQFINEFGLAFKDRNTIKGDSLYSIRETNGKVVLEYVDI